MAKVTFVKSARKDVPEANIKRGDSYYWWKFRYGAKQRSKTPPKQSQLTNSSFMSTVLSIQERMAEYSPNDADDFEAFRSEILSDIESLKEECESSLDNLPEALKDVSTGELLQERITALDEWYNEISGCEVEEEDDEDWALEQAMDDLRSTECSL